MLIPPASDGNGGRVWNPSTTRQPKCSRAGVSAAEAHLCAIHQVVDRIPERLIHVAVDVGVKADHLADGH